MPTKKSANRALAKREPVSEREAPPERSLVKTEFVAPVLNPAQMNLINNKTPDHVIKTRQGRGGNYRYVPHGYVTDQLNKIFGFNWDFVQVSGANGEMFNLREEEVPVYVKGKLDHTERLRHVTVFGYVEARVPYKGGEHVLRKSGAGSQLWLDGAELGDAIKGAISDCLKVCAQRFGIALDLYYSEETAIAAYEAKHQKDNTAAQVEQLLKQPPNTAAVLLSRAKSEYDVSLPEIEQLAGAKIGEIMNYNAADITKIWEAIRKAHPDVVDGEVRE